MVQDIKITKLDYPENIRQNVSMYLSGVDNFTVPLREIINNAVDEVLNKHGNKINIINTPEYKIVIDDSRGIPIYADDDNPEHTITRSVISNLHSGSKFDNLDEKTGGVHGVGQAAVNAVTDHYCVFVNISKKNLERSPKWILTQAKKFKNPVYFLSYKRGIFDKEEVIDVSGISEYLGVSVDIYQNFGTMVYFVPDLTIYESGKSSVSNLPLKLVYLENPNVEITVNGEVITKFNYFEDITEREVQFLDLYKEVEADLGDLSVKLYFSYSKKKFDYNHHGTINLIETPHGGFLERVVRKAFGDALYKYNSYVKQGDARYGLRLFYVVFSNQKMSFTSQTKEKLAKLGKLNENSTVNLLSEHIYSIFKTDKKYFQAVCQRIIEYKDQMNRLSNKDFIQSKIQYGDVSDRERKAATAKEVYEASSKEWDKRELFLVEGNSASAGLVQYRDKKYQSVLALRGKLRNTSATDVKDIVSNSEILAIINTIGCGVSNFTKIEKSRYGKIIIACDSDPDGCLRKGTKIKLLDGTSVPIEDLMRKEDFWVYSCTPDGKIVPGRGHSARITKYVEKLYEIKLDNGEIIECTDNHPFMLRDGSYKRADELTVANSLMPFYGNERDNDYSRSVSNVRVIELEAPEPVYDISVDTYHNFALDSGIFVHNSHISNLILALFIKHIPELIKAGKVFVLQVPFYVVTPAIGKVKYYYQHEKDSINFDKARSVEKRKGLGSYTKEEIKEYMTGPKAKLLKINWDDNIEGIAFAIMHSSTARKKLMQEMGVIE